MVMAKVMVMGVVVLSIVLEEVKRQVLEVLSREEMGTRKNREP